MDKNIALAVSYFEKASTLGYTKALTKLGHYYYSGYTHDSFQIPANIEKAVDLY